MTTPTTARPVHPGMKRFYDQLKLKAARKDAQRRYWREYHRERRADILACPETAEVQRLAWRDAQRARRAKAKAAQEVSQ